MYKEFLQIKKKKTDVAIGQWTNDRHFKKEDIQMTNKHLDMH